MNKTLQHDSFCRDVLADVSTFLEFVDYLASQNVDLRNIINLLDMGSLVRIPGDYSDTATKGYADLAFTANVKSEYLPGENPVQVCFGFLLEHKSAPDDEVMEQLRRYHFYLMVDRMKENAAKGIPSVAIILYNGKEKWNPLGKIIYPQPLRDIVLPFKCVFVDVDNIDDATCLETLSPRLGAFIAALKYARNPLAHKDFFKRILDRFGNHPYNARALELLASMDVYLHCWLSENFREVYNMDFVRPPYRTIADAEREEREALEKDKAALQKDKAALQKEVAESKEALAAKDAENAAQAKEIAAKDAKIAELEAALAAK